MKLPAEARAGEQSITGTTVRISESGLFLRSQSSFREGVTVSIRFRLSDGAESNVKGIVRYTRKATVMPRFNGMGIELTEKDAAYAMLIRSIEKASDNT